MIEVQQTETFRDWLASLRDKKSKAIIIDRVQRVARGLIGDAKFFDGIGELRVDHGPGYRVYFVKRGNTLIVLLCGGDKKTQDKDIKKAHELADGL